MSAFVDLHNHVLPGLDDGARTVAEAVELVRGLNKLGFSDIHPTPHQARRTWAPTFGECQRSVEHLRLALSESSPHTTHIATPAAENMWDDLFLDRRSRGTIPCYVGGKAFLVEFSPFALPPHLDEELFRFRVAGLLPVIAHIERYAEIAKDSEKAALLAKNAALLVNLSSLGGLSGIQTKRSARRLIRNGLVHAVTSDTHRVRDLHASAKGLAWLKKRVGNQGLFALLDEGPRTILTGEVPSAIY